MNGDELLTAFLSFLKKERPERFYPLMYFHDIDEPCEWKRDKYVPDYAWTVTIAKEACYGAYDAVLYRRMDGLVKEVIPLEVKADTDVLDERIRTQIWVHIRNFGKSMLLLGSEQAFKVKKSKLDKLLPTEIWAYNDKTFIQMTDSISKYHNHGDSSISQRALEKAFSCHEPSKLRELARKANAIKAVLNALQANQWRFGKEDKFTKREATLAYEIFGYHLDPACCEPTDEKDLSSVDSTGFSSKTVQKTLLEEVKGSFLLMLLKSLLGLLLG